jgi:hypothetical protein
VPQEPTASNGDAESVADPLEVPDTSLGDDMASSLQVVTSAIPALGGPLGVAIDRERRRYVSEKQDAFFRNVVSDLKRLGKTVDSLSTSFYGTVTYAAWLATLTNEQEKVDAFKNAVVNTALPNTPDEEMRELFLTMAVSLTARHLRLLNCLFHPREYGIDAVNSADVHVIGGGMGGAFKVIQQYVPGFERRDILERCINDLINQGLVYYQGQAQVREAHLMELLGNPLPTGLAHDFMAFMNPPTALSHADLAEDQDN